MEINIKSLVPFEKVLSEAKEVFDLVDKNGKIVVLKNNQPAYIIAKYEEIEIQCATQTMVPSNLTLQEAMRIVLEETDSRTMHASELADIIYNRKLYLQKNGNKAQYNQIRARCGHYPDMFEALPGNYIKLKKNI